MSYSNHTAYIHKCQAYIKDIYKYISEQELSFLRIWINLIPLLKETLQLPSLRTVATKDKSILMFKTDRDTNR